MAQKEYIVEGRRFRTEADYARASRDKALIDKLRKEMEHYSISQMELLLKGLNEGKIRFQTLLGQDFQDELEEKIRTARKMQNAPKTKNRQRKIGAGSSKPEPSKASSKTKKMDSQEVDVYVKEALKKREKLRKRLITVSALLAVGCLSYFGLYSYYNYRTQSKYDSLAALKEKPVIGAQDENVVVIHYTDEGEEPAREVLDEYKNVFNKNKKLIGWLKIDDTNIDYPVVQTSDNEYYLDHNLNQEYDKNGSIFMDKDCDILKPSTNFILYGHHMRSGQMFGKLDLYEKEAYYKEHPYIQFDTIYEKGLYQVMYAFRSRVYSEEEIVFKYYQFIDAVSVQEFDSNMQEMAAMSFYDTGVTAQYGDNLLTLSTCDYQEKNGRFVVVAKRIATKEE
ncbi:MAG: class B sortase [Lachnospiraceae bacterium]|nr:class B sortase [Lachnospiraceae bacterium]